MCSEWKTKLKTWQQRKQIHAICIFVRSVHKMTLLASHRVASFANTEWVRRRSRRRQRVDEADKAESVTALDDGAGQRSRRQRLLCICKKCRLKRPPTSCLCFIKYFLYSSPPPPPTIIIIFTLQKNILGCACVCVWVRVLQLFFGFCCRAAAQKVNIQKTK